jgi:hypothetical protein
MGLLKNGNRLTQSRCARLLVGKRLGGNRVTVRVTVHRIFSLGLPTIHSLADFWIIEIGTEEIPTEGVGIPRSGRSISQATANSPHRGDRCRVHRRRSASDLLIFEHLLHVSPSNLELRNSVNHIDGDAKAIDLVLDGQV